MPQLLRVFLSRPHGLLAPTLMVLSLGRGSWPRAVLPRTVTLAQWHLESG